MEVTIKMQRSFMQRGPELSEGWRRREPGCDGVLQQHLILHRILK